MKTVEILEKFMKEDNPKISIGTYIGENLYSFTEEDMQEAQRAYEIAGIIHRTGYKNGRETLLADINERFSEQR